MPQTDMPGSADSDSRPGIFTVVLTGGIASGKSATSELFAALGVPVIDTDRIAHEIVEPGQPALTQIAEALGNDFLDVDGRLDRRRMRQAVFANPDCKRRLEAILHPLITREAMHRVHVATGHYCILVIPLFAESARQTSVRWPRIDRVLVVDVDETVQIERLMARDNISREEALAIIETQAGRLQRLAFGDDIIDNSGKLEDLQANVEVLHRRYLQLAARI